MERKAKVALELCSLLFHDANEKTRARAKVGIAGIQIDFFMAIIVIVSSITQQLCKSPKSENIICKKCKLGLGEKGFK